MRFGQKFVGILACSSLIGLAGGCSLAPGTPPPTVSIIEPATGQGYRAGETITRRLSFEHFELSPPADHAPTEKGRVNHHDAGEKPGHSHANKGHYHVYLDGATGADPHVTAWTTVSEVPLAGDLSPGPHTLRVELRDDHHMPLGIETSVVFECVAAE